uniref:Uncharacterized protein n=1 Tax=Cucumis sativus TaxID=3659 RepID=A0A0A0LQX8_CUCSA
MTLSKPPNKVPPIKTAGNCKLTLEDLAKASNSLSTPDSCSSSTSYTAGLAPSPNRRRFTTWLIQHPLLANTIAALSETDATTSLLLPPPSEGMDAADPPTTVAAHGGLIDNVVCFVSIDCHDR